MFCGFDLKINPCLFKEEDYVIGKKINIASKERIEKDLERFIINDGVIDGKLLQEEWFPQINVNVFISHSHNDLQLAQGLVGWLYNNFRLKAFIDSSIWGSADNLLKMIDDKYCVNMQKESKSYSYEKRNFSTSHVHMMLSVALNKMIDNTECLLFLNTPESISVKDTINNSTFSPWLYSELHTSQIIRKQQLTKYRKNQLEKRMKFENIELTVQYDVDVDHLVDLNINDLKKWKLVTNTIRGVETLDMLYHLKGIL